MESKITIQSFINGFSQIDSLSDGLLNLERRIKEETEVVENIESMLDEYHRENNLPRLHLSVITPDTVNRKEDSKAISYPHIRCVAVYHIQGKKNRLSVFVGRLDELQDGINSPMVLTIARDKVFNHLSKTFTNLYSLDELDKSKINKATFLQQYQYVDRMNVTIFKYKSELEWKIAKSVESHQKINAITNEFLLPQINLTTVYPDVSKIHDSTHTITYPHVRCMVSYKVGKTKKRLNIYVGKLEDLGSDGVKAMMIAREKAFIHLQKTFPSLYC